MALRAIAFLLVLALAFAQQEAPGIDFVCPMDPEVRSPTPAKCSRCGMKLVAGLPEPEEYPVKVTLQPRSPRPGEPVELRFSIRHPKTGKLFRDFQLIHERLFHLFIVSRDLTFFAHEHPAMQADGTFALSTTLPQAGEYRLLSDFFPEGGTPQLIPKTVILSGQALPGHTTAIPSEPKNLQVELQTEPLEPKAGKKTMLFFRLSPGDGLEPYLGARGHLLAASEDLIDMIHSHPAFDEPGEVVQFNVIFPRPGVHRVWVQFQRKGKVNTEAFTVRVAPL